MSDVAATNAVFSVPLPVNEPIKVVRARIA